MPFYGIFADHHCVALSIAILVIATIGYVGVPLFVWTLAIAVIGIGFGWCPTTLYTLGALAAIFNIKPLRRILISTPIMILMKKLEFVPAISETERTAIEAGSVWVEGELFSGKPNFKRMLAESYPQLTKEEQAFLDGPVEKLCEIIDDWKVWQTRELPEPVWTMIKKEKLLGMIIPKEYGGLGFTALANSSIIKKISSRSLGAGITVMVPNSLGPAELLVHYGTEAQKKKLLPRLATGEEIPCFALTEPNAGSDAGGIEASGVLFKGADGKIYIRLNWNKRWITLAAISTILGLAFKLKDPDNLLGQGPELGITCALIPSNTPGVVLGRRHDPLGVPFYNCPTQGKDVVVLAEEVIVGGLEGAGEGWKMLMECLGAGRGISLPAQATSGAMISAFTAGSHASIRKQFGMAIGKFEGVAEPLARINASAYLLEGARRYTCGALDKGIKPAIVTAIAKYHFTETLRKCANDAMDILGGAGISRGPRNVISSMYIGLPVSITVEGANILTRTLMIFGQGALRAHPYAYKEVKAIETNNSKDFDNAFWGHIGHVVRNMFRSVLLSCTRGIIFIPPVCGPTTKYYRKLAWASASFAIMADIAMGTLGGKLKFKEQITGRFADIFSWLYLGTAVLRRFEAEGRRKEDLPLVEYNLQLALYNMQVAFDGIFSNFYVPGLSWVFRVVLRSWSSMNSLSNAPSDELTIKVAGIMQEPGEQRDRLVEGIYIPRKNGEEALGRLDQAFMAVKQAEGIDRKLRKAVRTKALPKLKGHSLIEEALKRNVISKEEHSTLERAEMLRFDAITVDSFTLEEYKNRA